MYRYARAAADDHANEPVLSACSPSQSSVNIAGSHASPLVPLEPSQIPFCLAEGGPAHLNVQEEDEDQRKDGHSLIVKRSSHRP